MSIHRRSLLTGLIAIPAAGAAGALIGASPAAAAPASIDRTAFKLRRRAGSYATAIAGLDAALPNVSVQHVLDDGNRAATRITAGEGAGLVTNFAAGFHFESGDDNTAEWIPQGITTSSDALDAGVYEDRKAVLVSWYSTGVDGQKGVRVSFVNRTDPLAPVYRHVLLVEPYTSGGVHSYRPVTIHAGGIAWYGHHLYVVDTSNGLRVFDLNHLWQVSSTVSTACGRQSDGSYQAFGYKYVLPQSLAYDQVGSGALRFSFISLDRTTAPDSFLVGEYGNPGTGTRLVRWGVDYTDRELVHDSGSTTDATASWAYRVDVTSMQGALSLNGKYFLSTSDGDSNDGDLGTWTPGGSVVMHYDTLPVGTEDFTYRSNTDELWTVSEYAGRRMAISVKAGAF
ncbi:hypothetical protein [Catellatospora citrea]|uniref:Secreted protein n=1 Tax=Catellatospora citrea TaxID=53366 RepID=A0A8J3P1P3_9ACTN|nr:hypothetical protein [Catellatospora citrea]RKE12345.1 hypothetical protein C8E86_7286 [Catellatospora citrea]GIG00856.1 hypothetical protein Cci01nite_59490 [Catellatospora citrea]